MCDQIRITNLILHVDYNDNPHGLLDEGHRPLRDQLMVSIDINNFLVAA
jgi:hypothetical protein